MEKECERDGEGWYKHLKVGIVEKEGEKDREKVMERYL